MPRRASRQSAEDVILQAVESVVERASAGISRAIAEILAVRIDEELRAQVAKAVGKGGRRAPARRPFAPPRAPSSSGGWRIAGLAGFPTSSSSRRD